MMWVSNAAVEAVLNSPLPALGVILVCGAALGGAVERAGVPWITGAVFAGAALGPDALGVLNDRTLQELGGFSHASIAIIAFSIGSRLVASRVRALGASTALLALAQLIAPLVLVLATEAASGVSVQIALLVAAVAPATAPTVTYSVIGRRRASGPFVDRALGVLAINDAAALLIFSAVSRSLVALLGAGPSGGSIGGLLAGAVGNEALSLLFGVGCGLVYVAVRALAAEGAMGWEALRISLLLGVLLVGAGAAIRLGLSPLLVPLAIGATIANAVEEREFASALSLIQALETPLFIVFFVLAGTRLPLNDLRDLPVLAPAVVYMFARVAGKYFAIYAAAAALRLDRATRRYLGLCFPAQGGFAIGLVLALSGSPAVRELPPAAIALIERSISIVLVAVMVSVIVGPLIIDFALRRGIAETDQRADRGGGADSWAERIRQELSAKRQRL